MTRSALEFVRVHQQGNHPSPRNQLRQQLKPLSRHLGGEHADPSEVAARPGEAGDQPVPDRIGATPEDDRDRRGRAFRGKCTRRAGRDDQIDVAADEIGGQCGQPIVMALRPAIFDRQILSLDIAGFAQSLAERDHKQCRRRAGRPGVEDADHRHRLLLRARSERPCRHHAGEKNYEIASPHARPLALTASRDYGSREPPRIGCAKGSFPPVSDGMGYIKKAAGKYKGSPQDRRRNKRIEDELRKGTSWSDIAERVGCGRATVARVATRLRRELAA